ncbi:CKLF-like MARVEL transmembrane domain-containing protein 5 isoform X2 [Dipodomys merriami]|uniref:CKLF-like MARVEL transmembrane domain-containing protein 5 isoform X2 n=1 Tax=Dipodomys merriami TaxID=94247 RepID=UPI00384E8CE8
MFSAWNRWDRPPEEGAAAELQGFAVDKTFLSSLKGILLETELYYQRFDRLNWPCLDFLRCVSAIIIFLVVSFAAVTSREGAAIAAFVFGVILISVFAYDAFKIYRTEMAPQATQGECLCPEKEDAPNSVPDNITRHGFLAWAPSSQGTSSDSRLTWLPDSARHRDHGAQTPLLWIHLLPSPLFTPDQQRHVPKKSLGTYLMGPERRGEGKGCYCALKSFPN